MRCEKVRLTIDAYVSGDLAPRDLAAIEEHVRTCDGCRREAEVARRLVALGQALPAPPVPDGFAQRVQTLARQRIARPTFTVPIWNLAAWWRLVPAPMHAAAAAVLVVGLSVGLVMGWTTLPTNQVPPAQTTAQADPLDAYNLDYLGDAPSGSLADSYLALVSGRNGEGK
jgi:anti-sigma factor RsiW